MEKTIENKLFVITDTLRVRQYVEIQKLREQSVVDGLTQIEVGYHLIPILIESVDGNTDRSHIVSFIDNLEDIEEFTSLIDTVMNIIVDAEKKKKSESTATLNE